MSYRNHNKPALAGMVLFFATYISLMVSGIDISAARLVTGGLRDVLDIGSNDNYLANLSNLANGMISYTQSITDPAGNVTTLDATTTLGLGNHNDGSANAPAGTPQLPNLLSGYVMRPPWKVAGVDYAVGIQPSTVLKDPTTATLPPGAEWLPATNRIVVMATPANSVTFDGYDFSLHGGIWVYIRGARNGGGGNVTIANGNFAVGANNLPPIQSEFDAGHVTISYCVIDGGGSNNGVSFAQAVGSLITTGSGGATIEYNWIKNAMEDGIDPASGPLTVEYNLFDTASFNTLAHSDWLQLNASPGSSNDNLVFEFNTVYQPATAPDNLNSMIRINMQVNNPVVAYNTAVGLAPVNNWVQMVEAPIDAPATVVNPSIHDNYFTVDPDTADHPWIYPIGSSYRGGIVNPNIYSNINLATGATLLAGRATSVPNAPVMLGDTINGQVVTLKGTAPANTTIDVFDGTNLLGATTANTSGAWSFTTGQLSNGAHAFTATATDAMGNTSSVSGVLKWPPNLGPVD